MSAFAKESATTIRIKKNALNKHRKKSPSPDPESTTNVVSSTSPMKDRTGIDISAITNKIHAQEKKDQQHAMQNDKENPTKAKSELKEFLTDYRGTRFEIDENSAALVQSACHDRKWGRPKKRDFVLQAIDRCGPDSQFKSSQQALRMILDGSKRYNEYLLRRVALENELETRREWLKVMLTILKDATGFSCRVPRLVLDLVIPALLPSQFCISKKEQQRELNEMDRDYSPLQEEITTTQNNDQNQKLAIKLWKIVSSRYIESSSADIISFLLKTELSRSEDEQQQTMRKQSDDEFVTESGRSSTTLALSSSSRNDDDDDDNKQQQRVALLARKSTTTKQLTEDIRLPILSYENFSSLIFEKIPESELLYPDVQLMLRFVIRGFNVNYSQLRKLFSDRNLHFHLVGNVGM
jgi:hypothetical protein